MAPYSLFQHSEKPRGPKVISFQVEVFTVAAELKVLVCTSSEVGSQAHTYT